MKLIYSDLQKYWAQRRGVDSYSDLDTKHQNLAKIGINMVYNAVWYAKQWAFSGRKLQFTSETPFSTGTAAGTAGGYYVTISGTTLSTHSNGIPFRGAYIQLNSKLYKIRYVDTTNNRFVLEARLTGAVASGSTYKVYFIEYPLRWDIGMIRRVRTDTVDDLEVRPESLNPLDLEEGQGELFFPSGSTDADYDTGTGTFTLNSNEVTSVTGVTLSDSQLIGKMITPQSVFDPYYIIDVDSANSKIILDRTYRGSTLAATAFVVNPQGTPLFGIYPWPDTRRLIEVAYTYQPEPLTADNDITRLPNDFPVLVGIDVATTKWETVGEKGFINEVLFQDKKFKEALKVLNFRGAGDQMRLHSLNEYTLRVLKDTNPWNRFRGRI